MSKIKTYSELIRLNSFEDRFNYLKLHGSVGADTFGFDRIFNQMFYQGSEWKRIREYVFLRDNGCDLGVSGYDIYDRYVIHHMNPISIEDLNSHSDYLLNPEYLITTTHNTHNAIHYGESNLSGNVVERKPNDTCPWK